MSYTRCLSLPVLSGFVLVTFVYYTTVVTVIRPWMGIVTANGLLNTIAYSIWYGMVLWCYTLSIFRDPGSVPAKYNPSARSHSHSQSDSECQHEVYGDAKAEADTKAEANLQTDRGVPPMALQEVKRKGGEPRFCQKCLCYKPPRAHHCRVCKRCVLRMDHHCIWINNCVGHRNYKAFVLFVLYDVLALLHGLVLLALQAMACLHPMSHLSSAVCSGKSTSQDSHYSLLNPSPTVSLFCRVLYAVICLPLGASLLLLLLWHLQLIALNKTTIEMAGQHGQNCQKRKCKEKDEEGSCEGSRQSLGGGAVCKGHGASASSAVPGAMSCSRITSLMLSRRSLIAMFLVHYEGVRARLLTRPSELKVLHPYDLGIVENLSAVLGPDPLAWLCPGSVEHLSSGVHFPTAYDVQASRNVLQEHAC